VRRPASGWGVGYLSPGRDHISAGAVSGRCGISVALPRGAGLSCGGVSSGTEEVVSFRASGRRFVFADVARFSFALPKYQSPYSTREIEGHIRVGKVMEEPTIPFSTLLSRHLLS